MQETAWRLQQIVSEAFAYLVDECGFRVVESDPTFVRFENADVFIQIARDRRAGEASIEFGRKDRAPVAFAR